MNKKLYAIYHVFDYGLEYGDALHTEELSGYVLATDDEIKDFIEKWNKPIVYDIPYDELRCHGIRTEEVSIFDKDISEFEPYDKYEDPVWGDRISKYDVRKQYMRWQSNFQRFLDFDPNTLLDNDGYFEEEEDD